MVASTSLESPQNSVGFEVKLRLFQLPAVLLGPLRALHVLVPGLLVGKPARNPAQAVGTTVGLTHANVETPVGLLRLD